MAHFAKLGVGNIVEQVIVVSNDIATTEQAGVDFINNLYKTRDIYKKTSFNTRGGKYYNNDNTLGDQSKAFRKNFAGIGFTYDQQIDAFIPPKIVNSWVLNEDTCCWKAPIEYPETYNLGLLDKNGDPRKDQYKWNEQIVNWELITS